MRAQEIEEMELAEKESARSNGLSLKKIKDRGWVKLNNGVLLEWRVDRPLDNGEARTHVPRDSFLLTINGKTSCFDTEEFRKWLRWC